MKALVGWVLAVSLVALPAMASKPGDSKADAAAASKAKDANADKTKAADNGKTDAAAKPETASIESEIQELRELILSQSKELETTRQQLQEAQHRMELLESALKASHEAPAAASAGSTGVAGAPSVAAARNGAGAPSAMAAPQYNNEAETPKSPLSFRIGGADFTPGGFMDFTSIFRTTNTGNPGGTNFFAIPYSNTVGGHLTESRLTAANSRVSLKVTDKFGKNDVTGYVEADFLGNDAANVFVTSNSHTFRQRLYWLDLKRDKWEFLAGQSWSWLTPNRVGLSPLPADVFYSQNEDFNYQVGLTWTRAPQFRVVYHPNDNWAMGIALENPQQFTGQGAEVTFPFAFNAQLGVQFDAANNSGTPNLHPDIIPKIAYDTDLGGKHFHAEAAGLLTSVKITVIPSGGTAFVTHRKTGGGLEAAVNMELVKNFHFVANGFWSDGGGRYIFGMGPGAVARPNAAGTDVDISLVHSGSGLAGFEAQVTPKTMFTAYYGGAYFQRNAFIDTTSPLVPKPTIGFGGQNSSNSANRATQEPTFGWIQTFWKNPQHGTVQFISQASYVTRAPWFVATKTPKNAHLTMVWLDLRYVLP